MIAALSVPEQHLSFYFDCDDQIQISCVVGLRKMENLAVTFCYLWLTEKLWLLGGTAPPDPPFPLQNIYYITTSHFLTTRPAIGCWLRKKVSTLTGYLLTDGLNCLTVKYLAGWQLIIIGCSSKTGFISSIIRLLCPALWHYVREHIIYTVYSDCVLVFAFAFLSCKKKIKNKICFKQDFLHWIIQKLAKICQDFKE